MVVGGGNIFRGVQGAAKGIDRATADQMGMLATVMNCLALEARLEAAGAPARTLSAVAMPTVCETYARQTALSHLAKGRVVLLAGGTGNPFFTTDTGGALRAAELGCDALLKATQVDGVYSADPKTDPTRGALRPADPFGGHRPPAQGDGHRGVRACPREPHAYHRLLDSGAGRDHGRAAGGGEATLVTA